MGAAWCRHRAEQAHDSKSPFDRVIVRCVDKFYSVDADATPVRLPKPTPGGVNTVSGNEGASEELLKYNSPMRLAGGAGAWQKASLQVPRAEQPLMALPDTSKGYFCDREDRTPVPPPRRKRASLSAAGTAPRPGTAVRAPPPRPPSQPLAPPPAAVSSKQLLSPPKPRPANTSTVSLPEWRELQRSDEDEDAAVMPPRRPSSASPRPAAALLRPPSVTSVSDETLERVGTYLRRCRSFGNMSSSGLVEKLSSIEADSDSDVDPWEGVDDFEHTCGPLRGSPPHTPRSRVDRRKISAPAGPTRRVSDSEGRKRKSGVSATAPVSTSTPASTEEISTDRFFVSSAEEDDWFNRDYHREATAAAAAAAPPKEPEGEISEVKKELQSIIYNYNRTKKISTSSMNEVLPTQPVRVPKRKKISVASITPPPSPMSSDVEDAVPPSAVINGEEGGDATAHSTLLRLLRECQTIEGALEDMTAPETDMPSVHHALRKLSKNNHHLKEREINNQVTQSHDSGLDVRGILERAPSSGDKTTIALPAAKNADSGVDEDEGQASRTTPVADSVEKSAPSVEAGTEVPVKRCHPDTSVTVANTRLDDDADSSGRSSMTPSLSELEAALSDMLEKSAADEDERASPLPSEQVHVVPASAAAVSSATLVDGGAAAAKDVAEPVPTTGAMLIPKISVTSDSSPSVH